MGAVGGLDALHCEQRRREKAEAAAQAWWAKAEEEAKEFSNAMRTVFEQTERSTKLLYSSSVRKENRMICRCSWGNVALSISRAESKQVVPGEL